MADATLRVAQLNAGSLLEPGWDERCDEIVAWLTRLDPDVVCFQEIWEDDRHPNTATQLAERAGAGWSVVFGGEAFAADLWPDHTLRFGSAVLSRWPIDGHEYHRLSVGPDPSPLIAGVPWEVLHVRTAGLDVFSVHLAAPPEDGRHRRRQVVALDEVVRAVRGDRDALHQGRRRVGMPAIVCGDFNAEPDSDEMRFLRGLTDLDDRSTYYQDAWGQAGDGFGLTQDWRTHPISAAMNVPRKRIDYVLVGDPFQRQGDAGRVLSAERAFHEPMTGVQASDHAGLVVDIAWPDRPST